MTTSADPNVDLTFRMWRTRRTVLQMCRDRGYAVTDAECSQTLDEFKTQFGSNPANKEPARSELNFVVPQPTEEHQLGVFFPDSSKIGISDVREIYKTMSDQSLTRALVIVKGSMTPSAKKALTEEHHEISIQAFMENELVVNITQHEMVPKHEPMTTAEKKELLKRYKLTENQLPRIKLSDPVAKYYGLRRGQVVRIMRPSPTAGRYVTYRLVH